MKQTLYEMLYIIDAGIEESQVQRIQNDVKETINSVGELTKENVWGRRRLAYPVKKKTEGIYVDLEFTATNEAPNMFRELFHTRPSVLRHLCLKVPKTKIIQEKREAELQRRRQETIEKERLEREERLAAAAAAAQEQEAQQQSAAATETAISPAEQPEQTASVATADSQSTSAAETPAESSSPAPDPAPQPSENQPEEPKPTIGEQPAS